MPGAASAGTRAYIVPACSPSRSFPEAAIVIDDQGTVHEGNALGRSASG